jgi:hypothetical protein
MLLVVARLSQDSGAMARAAQVTGLVPADLSRRLVGTLPRVLLPTVPTEQADSIAEELEKLGFVAFGCDATAAPSDNDRVLVRGLDFGPDGLLALDGKGQPHACPGSAIAVFQRGVRVTVDHETIKSTERRLDMGKALLTGGLALTSKVEKTTSKRQESRETMLLVQRLDGEPDLIVYERRLDYRFLGSEKQPASATNLELTLQRLRALAPHAPLDDRVAKPGFVMGLPLTQADPLDLALFLVSLARTRGC